MAFGSPLSRILGRRSPSGVSVESAGAPLSAVWERLSAHLDALPASLRVTGQGASSALVDLLKEFVAAERQRIEALHREGASGWEIVAQLTDLADAVVDHLFRLAHEGCAPAVAEKSEGCALLALGGYGRRELNPASDVDLMVLYPRRVDPYLDVILHGVLPTLWDIGFVVGHSCRSLEDCVRMANLDLTSRTSMMEARYLTGHPRSGRAIYEVFVARLKRLPSPRQAAAFIREKVEEQESRYARYGGSVYVQEPHVKESAGSLRDFHLACWIARVRTGGPGLEKLAEEGLVDSEEVSRALQASDFLLRLRTDLHYLARGKQDVLLLSLQEQVARRLGFVDLPGRHAVEQLMQQYYLAAKEIYLFSQHLSRKCLRETSQVEVVMNRLRARDIGDGLTEVNHQIHVLPQSRSLFAEDPVRLMKVFWYAQQTGYDLSPETRDLIRASLSLIDDKFRSSNRVFGFFLAVLREPRGVARTLRLMHELGVLSAYIPEFAKLTCLVQFDFYHKYTVDEHTFMALENYDRLGEATGPYTEEFQAIAAELKRPEILKLSVLLHDIGKGEGHGHVVKGMPLVDRILARMGLPEGEAREVRFAVEHHLTMSQVAERRDLDDEQTIIEFAKIVGETERLKRLYLLTYLDIKAVGPEVWTEWKASLLWELYIQTQTILTRGIPEGADEISRSEAIRGELQRELQADFPGDEIERHLANVSPRYLLTTSAAKVASHLLLLRQIAEGAEVACRWENFPLAGYAEFTVCAYGQPGRFAQIVGTLTANGVNILSAQVSTLKDGMVIRSFRVNVTEGKGSALPAETVWEQIQKDLLDVLVRGADVREMIRTRRREILARPARRGPAIPTQVEFDNLVSTTHSVIDVRTQDRLGLLYLISSALSEMGVDVRLAKITTEGTQVVDVFYVTERDGSRITSETRQEEIRRALEQAISEGLQ